MKYLVIVESPAKKNKIQEFLNSIPNHSFIVEASYGHIRYFANKLKIILNLLMVLLKKKIKLLYYLRNMQKK